MATPSPDMKVPPHLSPDRTIHVLISTLSGGHQAEDYYTNHLLPLLTPYVSLPRPHLTTSASSISQYTLGTILPLAQKGTKQTILLLSGDGGIVDIVNTLTSALMRDTYDYRPGSVFVRPVVILFPLGTANALAGSAGINLGSWTSDNSKPQDEPTPTSTPDPTDAITISLKGTPKPLPIFSARFSPDSTLVTNEGQSREPLLSATSYSDDPILYGAVVFSWGLHASLVAASDTTEYRKHGVDRFKMAAAELMQEEHLWRGNVKLKTERDGEWEDLIYPTPDNSPTPADEHVYILAPLVSQLDPGFLISPETKTPDDTLRILAVAPPPQAPTAPSSLPPPTTSSSADAPSPYTSHLTTILGAAYAKGTHIPSPHILYTPISALRIQMHEEDERWRYVCVDGKIVSVGKGGFVEVRMLVRGGMDGRRVVDVVCP